MALPSGRCALAACALAVTAALGAASCGARTGLPTPERWSECSIRAPVDPAPIEINILMDTSHSMDFASAEGVPKWDAVREAVRAFLVDPASAGLSVSLTFFPEGTEEEQGGQSCSVASPCADPRAGCVPLRGCFPSLGAPCTVDADCPGQGFPNDSCRGFGLCAGDGSPCATDDPGACGAAGPCDAQSICAGGPICDAGRYRTPSVPLGALPAAAAALVAALDARATGGGTPTLPALDAVVEAASARARQAKTHAVLVLLATDGFPSACDGAVYGGDLDGAIGHLAGVAAGGVAAGARTFVIGVVTPGERERARENLDRIARAGGTQQALLVTTDDSVGEGFLAALQGVRVAGASCAQALPIDAGVPGRALDTVRVRLRVGAGVTQLSRRSGPDDCAGGGFYVEAGGAPARVVLCAATCNEAGGGEIEVGYPCDYDPGGAS